VVNTTVGRLLAVYENRSRPTFAQPAAIIGKFNADRGFARRKRLVRDDCIALEADPVAAVRDLSAP